MIISSIFIEYIVPLFPVYQGDKASGRGTTIIKAKGGYQQDHRDVVMCACRTKEMHLVEQAVKKVDPAAFTVIIESNEVLSEGFKKHSRSRTHTIK